MIDLPPGFDPARDIRRSVRGTARNGRNRLVRDGHTLESGATRDPQEVARLLPEVERIRRARDAQARGFTDLDDPEDRAFWQAVVRAAAERGALDLATLHIDGRLSAYMLAFLDNGSFRVWDPRFDPEYARYNLGHVLRDDVLARVAREGACREFDWMRGVEDYKLRTATRVVPSQTLRAWSSGLLRRAEETAKRGRGMVVDARRQVQTLAARRRASGDGVT